MIKPLRKIHLQVWALLAVLIPVGILVSWMALPKKVTQDLDRAINSMPTLPGQTITVDQTISSIENENYQINIRGDSSETLLLLQFETKKDMVTPSLLLYHVSDSTTNDIDKQELIGRIRGNRPHFFSFTRNSNSYYKYILYDIIKKQTIDSLIFKTSLLRRR
jgi:hypothetical protein